MESSAFDKLFSKNMPHILEAVFFSLDYESYKVCLNVSMVWKSMLTSKAFQKKGESVFHKDILLERLKLQQSAQNGNKDVVINLLSTGMLDIDCGSTWNRWSLSPLGLAAYTICLPVTWGQNHLSSGTWRLLLMPKAIAIYRKLHSHWYQVHNWRRQDLPRNSSGS